MEELPVKKTLVFIFRGYSVGFYKYESLKRTVLKACPSAEVKILRIPLKIFSFADPNEIVQKALETIDLAYAKWEGEEVRIVLIGHSTGAVIARKVYVVACGENKDAPFERYIWTAPPKERKWAKSVERLILFAGINRGWTINEHINLLSLMKIQAAIVLGKLLHLFGFEPIVFKFRKGATFITQLRIQSLSMIRQAEKKKCGDTLTIQLLGTKDDLVSPEDCIDLVTGSGFIYLDVPYSDHMNVIDMKGKDGEAREKVVINAITMAEKELRTLEVITSDDLFFKQDLSITDVVFVIHGIRDRGYWTQKIASRVKKIGDRLNNQKYATETSTYGYFPLLSFLLNYERRSKVEWLMDQYTENLSRYPNASFSFIGHSNGTYLLAKALERYPACKFKNIVLAGSVVRSNYNWMDLIQQNRVNSVYNFVATDDLVVGIFPKTFQFFGHRDLGGAGFDGFNCLPENGQFMCISGGHGAAITESFWEEIAYIAVHGQPSNSLSLKAINRSGIMRFIGHLTPLILLALLAFFVAVAIAILSSCLEPVTKSVLMVIYLFLIYKLLVWY